MAGGAKISGWEARAQDLAKRGTGGVQDRVAKIGVVENIEKFGAELQIEALGDLGVFGDGEISVHEIGATFNGFTGAALANVS